MLVDLEGEEASEPIPVSTGHLPPAERVGRLVQETLRIDREMRREALEIGLW